MPLVERKKFQIHPECLTELQLVTVELDEEGDYGAQIRWTFDSDELMEDQRPFRITYWTTPTLNEKSNLYRLLKAFGENPEEARWEVEEVAEFDPLIGRRVQANIIHKKRAQRDGTVSVNARIDSVMPLPRKTRPGRDAREAREAAPAAELVLTGAPRRAGTAAGRDAAKWDDAD